MEIIIEDIFYNIWAKIKNNGFHLTHITSDYTQNPNSLSLMSLLCSGPAPPWSSRGSSQWLHTALSLTIG